MQRAGLARETHQVVKDTLVQLPLGGATLPELMVPVVQALPVLAELGEAVGVDVLDPAPMVSNRSTSSANTLLPPSAGP